MFCKFVYFNSVILNKMAEQFRILEYPLIILFVIIGGVFLITSCDLISIFLSIELQSYGRAPCEACVIRGDEFLHFHPAILAALEFEGVVGHGFSPL